MSAIPKKKLCWNCEGNVSREIDNCPYCGVYLHGAELEESSYWNPSQHTSKTEEIPSPLYQIHQEEEAEEREESNPIPSRTVELFSQLKQDVLPILGLMTGSVFFLFSMLLFLFAQNGTLTLQWDGSYWLYFFLMSIPCLYIGWRTFQRL